MEYNGIGTQRRIVSRELPDHVSPVVASFCRRYDARFVDAVTEGNGGSTEAHYFFDDQAGGYTLRALKKSLDE